MRYLLAMLAITCGIAAGRPTGADLTVLIAGNDVPPLVLTAMEHEAESALAPAALHLTWKTKEDRQGDFVVSGPMAIIHMRGQCVADPSAAMRTAAGARLGVTHIADGQILPFADVLCDAVRDFVSPDLRGSSVQNRDDLLGRALGRVLAHELYHILVQTADHGNDGLSRQRQSSADLLVPHRSFVLPDQRRIGESIRGNLYGFAASDSGR